jgi:hypothetical protein
MILNSGMRIDDPPDMSEKTRKYLNQFWHFPSKEDVIKEKDKHYNFECKREWQRRDDQTENEINP